MSLEQFAEGGHDLRVGRVVLTVAVAVTVSAIAAGTWVLGSGSDPGETQRTAVIADLSAPHQAQPPLPVAPLPAPGPDDNVG
jgi:hypothetical protein